MTQILVDFSFIGQNKYSTRSVPRSVSAADFAKQYHHSAVREAPPSRSVAEPRTPQILNTDKFISNSVAVLFVRKTEIKSTKLVEKTHNTFAFAIAIKKQNLKIPGL